MESTPLELYETAYRFHYQESRIQDAVNYYQKLIKEFPDSNECGYAVIQLQKIKAQDVAQSLHDGTAAGKTSSFHPLIPITLIFSFLASAVLGLTLYSLDKKLTLEKERLSLTLDALGKISRRDDDGALKALSDLKKILPENMAPWELSADVYRKQNKYDDARNEYAAFFRLHPQRKPTQSETYFMELKEKKPEKKVEPAVVIDTIPKTPTPPPPGAAASKKRLLRAPAKTKATKPPTPGSGKQKNGPFLVDPDSISYF